MIMTAVLILRWAVLGVLAAFLCRRALFLGASLLPARPSARSTTRAITLLVAARNEALRLPTLLAALARLEYPASLLDLILISDGSDDGTAEQMRGWQDAIRSVRVVELPNALGKGGALAAGLATAPPSDLVVVLDADSEPRADILKLLAGAFDDPRVGAASAYPEPGNAYANRVARYAALERWVHHLVLLAGKDRLAMDPPIVGVTFAVRREALDAAGGFPTGRLSEDLELSMALTAAGWRTRWIGAAVVRENVVETHAAFRQQRTRWSRGMLQSAPRIRSVEDLFTAAGYLDRLALAVAVVLVPFGVVQPWWPALYLTLPAVTVLVALRRARARPIVAFLTAAVGMLATDVLVSLRSAGEAWLGKPATWGRRD